MKIEKVDDFDIEFAKGFWIYVYSIQKDFLVISERES